MSNKKKNNREEKQPIIDDEISRIFSDLLKDALKITSPLTGFRKGAEFYSKGMAAIMKRSNHGECILREQTDREIFTVIDYFDTPPPPPANSSNKPKDYYVLTDKALCELVVFADIVKDIINKEPDKLEDAVILYVKLKYAYENSEFMKILVNILKKDDT
jgi:hypothetical protein